MVSITIKEFETEDRGFYIGASSKKGFFSMSDKHIHDRYEIYYLVSGERYYFIKDKTFRIKRGYFVLVNEGELHKTTDTELPGHERVLLYFRRDFIMTPCLSMATVLKVLAERRYCVLCLTLKEQRYIEAVFSEMNEEITARALGFEACLQARLMLLVAFIARRMDHNDEEVYVSRSPKHEKVSEIIRYLDEHFSEPITVSGLSGLFFISPYYLSRIFKETTGFTLIEYINSKRVKAAGELLKHSGLKVIQVAERSGFGSVAHFNRVFRAVTGFSPLSYRRNDSGPARRLPD